MGTEVTTILFGGSPGLVVFAVIMLIASFLAWMGQDKDGAITALTVGGALCLAWRVLLALHIQLQ